jgi:broad specificity phosphatase PhoE
VRFVLVHQGEATTSSALSEAGLLRARVVAAELRALGMRGQRHAAVLASPRPAPFTAAELIADALELGPPDQREELQDASTGDGYEALESLQESAWALIEALKLSQEPDATLILVTHELTVRALVCRALSMPLADMRRFALDPGSFTVLEYRTQPRERMLIASLNESCHLERAPTS